MGSWRKVGAFLGLVPEDGQRDDYNPEYDDQPGYRDDDRDGYQNRREYRGEYSTDEYAPEGYDHAEADYVANGRRSPGYVDEPMTHGSLAVQSAADLRAPDSAGAVRPITIKLTGFAEARVIGEKYRDGKPVILDMTEMDDSDARRLVDFAAGLAFAMRGAIDKVTTKVFMLLPPDTDATELSSYETAASQTGFTAGFGPEMSGRGRALAGARGR